SFFAFAAGKFAALTGISRGGDPHSRRSEQAPTQRMGPPFVDSFRQLRHRVSLRPVRRSAPGVRSMITTSLLFLLAGCNRCSELEAIGISGARTCPVGDLKLTVDARITDVQRGAVGTLELHTFADWM